MSQYGILQQSPKLVNRNLSEIVKKLWKICKRALIGNLRFILNITPINRDIFVLTARMWLAQFSLSLTITPKNLASVLRSIGVLSILTCRDDRSTRIFENIASLLQIKS